MGGSEKGGATEGTHWDRRMFPVAVEVALCGAVLGVKGVRRVTMLSNILLNNLRGETIAHPVGYC